MRNRVALQSARTRRRLVRISVVMTVVSTVLVAGARFAAAAAPDRVAAESASFEFGPVSIAAVVLGAGGLVVGLLRHRRREVQPRRGERAA